MKPVTVIIPNWNGRELLGGCLRSLYRQVFVDFDTIVVDNGSEDGSVAFLEKNFPHVTVLRFEDNTGFSRAVNAGIAASQSQYVALLNNDAEVHPLWLKELVGALEADPQAGSAASKILLYDDPTSINSAGDEFSLFGIAYHRRLRRGDAELFQEPCYVFSACAASALYRRELFERVGLFDETFFAYQEDIDLGFRAQLAGYRCLFVPGAIAYHKYHATSSRVEGLRIYLNQRNKYFVLIKNLPTKLFLLCLPLILSFEAFCFVRALLGGHVPTYVRALKDVCADLSEMVRYRRLIQAARVVSDAYLLGLMRFRDPLVVLVYIVGSGFLHTRLKQT